MAKKGVSAVSGNTSPVVGEKYTYSIASWYPETEISARNPAKVTWELYRKRGNGKFTSTNIKKVGSGDFTFGEAAAGHTYRLEAYRYNPEGGGLIITPKPAKIPKINKVELFYVDDTKGNVFSFMEKLRVRANCVNMFGKELVFTLWEDDVKGLGHNASNQAIDAKKARVNKDGIAVAEFTLTAALMRKAARGEMDSQLEFYVTVEYYTHKKHATDNVNVKNPFPAPSQTSNQNQTTPKAPGSPAANKPASKKEEAGIMETISKGWGDLVDYVETKGRAMIEQLPTFPKPTNVSANKVGTTQVEGLTDAYFAKKEFTKLTGQENGSYEYTFGGTKANNNTATAANKEKVANAILKADEVNEKLKSQRKYTTKEAIVAALTATEYGRDTQNHKKVSFKTFKLDEEFKRIQSAPLEEKVYLVATSYFLEGKTATITVKEKDGIIAGSADAVLPLSEITEAKMSSTEALTEADRTEKTTFSGTIAKVETGKDADGKAVTAEMYIVPVQLRPKTDADLAVWKEKIAKGAQDGEYTYTFKNGYGVIDSNKGELAAAIVNNAKKGSHGNPKLDAGKTVHAEDVRNVLQTKTYASGETIKFPVYKKVTEMLWLEVTASGTKEHKKDFLKGEGAYFEIGKKCPRCDAEITLQQIEDLFGVHSRSTSFRTEVVMYLNQYIQQRKNTDQPIHINTCLRKAHFFAQVGAETLGINTDWIVETDVIPYQPSNINTGLFGDRSTRLRNRGQLETFCSERPQIKLLSFLYAAENGFGNGNGNEASGDGYRYRGRGLKQLTGRGNYRTAAVTLREIFPNEYFDLEAQPEKLKEAKYAVLSAIAYWEKHKIWQVADEINISNDDNVKRIRRTVNGGTAGWRDAKKYFEKGIEIFKVNDCSPVELNANSNWRDPVDNPEITLYNYYGVYNPAGSSFGKVRNNATKNHQGLDIFAPSGTPIRACLDGTVVIAKQNDGNWGKLIVIEVSKEDLENSRNEYTLQYKGEIEKGSNYHSSDQRFLRFAHLSQISIAEGSSVKAGDIIGLSGNTGNALGQNVRARHLHFGIANVKEPGLGTSQRENPAFYVNLTAPNDNRQKNNNI